MTDQQRPTGDRSGGPPMRGDAAPHDTPALGVPAEARRLIESFGLSHTGKVREANEDHFVTAALQRSVQLRHTNLEDTHVFDRLSGPRAYLFVVADGVGGSAGGGAASAIAVATIVKYLGEIVGAYNGYGADHANDFPVHLKASVLRAHDSIVDTFRLKGRGGPATTLTLAMIVWPSAYLVHVGDSRAYHLRAGTLRRLTRDQTVGDVLVTEHGMPKEKAVQAGLYNVLSSAIGAEDVTPVMDFIPLEHGDTLLLCTDGLTKHVPDERIGEVLSSGTNAEAGCRTLVDLALADGGSDNVTAVVARVLGG